MVWLTLAALGVLVFAGLVRLTSPPVATAAAVVVTTCLVPVSLTGSADTFHVGIAGPQVELRTFAVATFALLAVAVARFGLRCASPAHLLFVGWMAFAAGSLWQPGPLLSAGVMQLSVGIGAWWLGNACGRLPHAARDERLLCWLLAGVVALEVVVCLLQFSGFPVNQLSASDASILGTRVNGSANHPNNLGKLLIAVLVLLLPLTEAEDRRTSRLALAACLGMFVPLGLAQGRANMAAFLCAVVLWTLLSRATSQGRRFVVIAGTCAGIAASATAFAARFEEDPTGGVRGQILRIALDAIPHRLWSGVGPNSYVAEVSAASGSFIPVHNTFVLLLAEVGLVGAVLYLAPVVLVAARSAVGMRHSRHWRAVAVVLPGLFAIGWTGWGLLGTSVLPFLMFTLAYTARRARVESGGDDAGEQRHTERHEGHQTAQRVAVPLAAARRHGQG